MNQRRPMKPALLLLALATGVAIGVPNPPSPGQMYYLNYCASSTSQGGCLNCCRTAPSLSAAETRVCEGLCRHFKPAPSPTWVERVGRVVDNVLDVFDGLF